MKWLYCTYRVPFEADLEVHRTLDIRRRLCRGMNETEDEAVVHDVKIVRDQDHNNFRGEVNADLQIAMLYKLGAFVQKKKRKCYGQG